MGSSSRVSIPKNARLTIHNIKEITGNHNDEEVYAMLWECSIDPNETTQKLLLQEIKEPAETRCRPPSQGRGGRGGRGNYSSRYVSHDAGSGRVVGKENGIPQGTVKGNTLSSAPSQKKEAKSTIHIASSVVGLANGLTKVENPTSARGSISEGSGVSGTASVKENLATTASKTGSPPICDVKSPESVSLLPSSDQFLSSTKPASVSRI